MQKGIYHVKFKLNVENLNNPEMIIDNMDYSVEAPEISETEVVASERIDNNNLLVEIKIYLELDMDYAEAQESFNEAEYYFHYSDDEGQNIIDTEMVEISDF